VYSDLCDASDASEDNQ